MNSEQEPKPVPLTFEQIVEAAKEHVLANGGHPPLLILDGESDTLAVDLDLPYTAEQRIEQMYIIGIGIGRTNSVGTLRQAFLISEAWNTHVEPGQKEILMPSDDPKRREILLIMGIRLTPRQSQIAIIEMQRDAQGIVRELTDITTNLGIDLTQPSPQLGMLVSGYTQGRASMTGTNNERVR